MIIRKDKILENCTRKGFTVSKLLMEANIQSGDFYQALKGKKPFFPAWRRRISEVLEVPEMEIFEGVKEVK